MPRFPSDSWTLSITRKLPVEALVPHACKTWNELRQEYEEAKTALDKSTSLHDFKRWLEKTYRCSFSPSVVRQAAALVTDVPEEFTRLGRKLREVSSRPRG